MAYYLRCRVSLAIVGGGLHAINLAHSPAVE